MHRNNGRSLPKAKKHPHPRFLKDFIYLFLDRGEGREKERERSINVWLLPTRPPLGTRPETQAQAPVWETNRQPSGSQGSVHSVEPHQEGSSLFFFFF